MRLLRVLLGTLLILGFGHPATAHDGLPVALSVRQTADDLYLTQITLPPSLASMAPPMLALPQGCQPLLAKDVTAGKMLHRCADRIGGRILRLRYAGASPALPILTRVEWLSGETQTLITPPGETAVALPVPENGSGVFRHYFGLGAQHILEGLDHLLFLLCLLLIARTGRPILFCVTGFTLGHAVTITLVSLGVAGLPRPPIEAAIALSIMFLAAEIVRGRSDTLSWRHPVAVSSIFGVLHGFGFASALRDIGLPQTEVPLALLAFNLGIEAGQLLFVLASMGLWFIAVWARRRLPRWSTTIVPLRTQPIAYVVGSVAAVWFIERLVGA